MNIYILTILLLLTGCPAFAQNNQVQYFDENWYHCEKRDALYYRVITYDENGNPKGIVKDYFITGELQWQGQLISEEENIFDGTCIWYYRNGQIQQKIVYVNQLAEGETVTYYENGALKYKALYKKDKIEGSAVSYYMSGKIESEVFFVNGMREGKSVQYYENGQLSFLEYYINNVLDGKAMYYYPDGRVKNVSHWNKGIKEGESVSYFSDGKIWERGMYRNGKLAGEYEQYFESGQLQLYIKYNEQGKEYRRDSYYYNGMLSGRSYYLSDSTQVLSEYNESAQKYRVTYNYTNGIRKDSIWWDNTQLKATYYTKKGTLIHSKEYDRYGFMYRQFPADSNTVYPVKNNSSCLYGFKNLRGSMVVLPQYDVAMPFWKGYSIVAKNNLWGLVDQYGKVVMPLKYQHLEEFHINYTNTYTSDEYEPLVKGGYYRFKINGRYGIIHVSGKIIVQAQYDEIANTSYGYALLTKDKRFGIADTSGVLIEAQYSSYGGFLTADFIQFVDTTLKKRLVTNNKGEVIIPPLYDNIVYRKGCFVVWKDTLAGLYSSSGQVLLDPGYHIDENYSYMEDYPYSTLPFRINGLYGLYDFSGKWILQPEYKIVYQIPSAPYCFAAHTDKMAIYAKDGKRVTEEKYIRIQYTINNITPKPPQGYDYFLCYTGSGYEILDRGGQKALSDVYDYAEIHENQYFITLKGNKVSVYRCDTVLLPVSTDMLFASVFADLKGLPVEENIQWITNSKDELIYPREYYISRTEQNYAVIHSEVGSGIINDEGKTVIPVGKYRDIFFGKNNTFMVMNADGLLGVMNEKGKMLLPMHYDAITDYDETIKGWWVYTENRKEGNDYEKDYTWDTRWGAVGTKQKVIIPSMYAFPLSFDDMGCSIARIRGGTQIVDTKGKVLVQTSGKLESYNRTLFIINRDGDVSLLSLSNAIPDSSIIWNDITIPMGDYALLYSGNAQALMDTTGKIIYTAENGFHTTSFDLSEYIQFSTYSYDGEDGALGGYPQDVNEVIYGYDKIFNLDNDRAKIHISNLLYTQVAKNYSFINSDNYSYVNKRNAPYHNYGLGIYFDEEKYYNEYENIDFDRFCSSSYDISLESVNVRSFSYINSVTNCCAGYRSAGYCDYDIQFINYAISGDSIWEISLGELFVLGADYSNRIDKLLRSKLAEVEGLEIDCSNQDAEYFFELYGENVTITPEGLKFYIVRSDEELYDENGDGMPAVTIEYNLLYDMINKNSVLGEFVK